MRFFFACGFGLSLGLWLGSATASVPSVDPATCAQQAGVAAAHCKWSVAYQGKCGGAAFAVGQGPQPTAVCVCNGCESDADCTARKGGKCETFGLVCRPQAKVCTYPGELCFDGGRKCARLHATRPGNRTPEHKACHHDGLGHAVCDMPQYPPP